MRAEWSKKVKLFPKRPLIFEAMHHNVSFLGIVKNSDSLEKTHTQIKARSFSGFDETTNYKQLITHRKDLLHATDVHTR